MDRKTAAKTLRDIGRMLEVAGANPYRARAFAAASRALDSIGGDLEEAVATGAILEVKGIGKTTAAVLSDLVAGRRPEVVTEIESMLPEGVREMLTLPGLGPKKVRVLWRDLGVETLGELEYACRENRLVDLKGFGPRSQAAVLEAVRFRSRARDRRLLHQAWAEGEDVAAQLSAISGVERVIIGGELRRGCETVGELSLVLVAADTGVVGRASPLLGRFEPVADGEWVSRRENELPIRLVVTPIAAAGTALVRATGDHEFVEALAARGLDSVTVADEAAVFEQLGLPWIPPELREGSVWLGGPPPELVEPTDCAGALHNHTTDSDGAATLEAMAAAAAERGWRFFGVADHSPAAVYANGVDAARLRDQGRRADEWNASHPGLRIVKGLEADILPDGSLDLPDGCAAGLDYVVASVHSSFRMDEEAQTERIIAAARHPACRVLGHPTGRLLLARPGYAVDLDRVLDACGEHGVAVEINASPYRLDLDHRWARAALDRGLKLAVNPDAHSVDGLDDLRWGVTVARRAGATKADLVNCMDIEAFLAR